MELMRGRTKLVIQFMRLAPLPGSLVAEVGKLFGSSKAGLAHAMCQPADQRGYGLARIGRLPAVGADHVGDCIDDSRSNDHAICGSADDAGLFGRLDPEPDEDRQW